jgi:hypothetical protein
MPVFFSFCFCAWNSVLGGQVTPAGGGLTHLLSEAATSDANASKQPMVMYTPFMTSASCVLMEQW